MSEEFTALPLVTFKTSTNTELGAESISIEADGSIVFRDVLKQVTESMLTSYPRTQLGLWMPNRAAVRYPGEEIDQHSVKKLGTNEELDAEAIRALAS
jgi:hypothetical protein